MPPFRKVMRQFFKLAAIGVAMPTTIIVRQTDHEFVEFGKSRFMPSCFGIVPLYNVVLAGQHIIIIPDEAIVIFEKIMLSKAKKGFGQVR